MKTAMVFLILLLVLLTQDFVEVVTFLMFFVTVALLFNVSCQYSTLFNLQTFHKRM